MDREFSQLDKVLSFIYDYCSHNQNCFNVINSIGNVLTEVRKISNEHPYLFNITKKTIHAQEKYDGPRGTASSFFSKLRRNEVDYDKFHPLLIEKIKLVKIQERNGVEYIYIDDAFGCILNHDKPLTNQKKQGVCHGNSQYMLCSIFKAINYNIYVPLKDKETEKGNIYTIFDIDTTLGCSNGKNIDFIGSGVDYTILAEVEESTGLLSGMQRMLSYSNSSKNKIISIIISSKSDYKYKFSEYIKNNKSYSDMNIIFVDYKKLKHIYDYVLEKSFANEDITLIRNYIFNNLLSAK